MKRTILLLLISILSLNLSATHIMGGEITWVCIKDPSDPDVGKYIFKMKVYRDCDGTTLSTFSQIIEVWDGGANPITNITLNFDQSNDISPVGDAINSGYACLDCNTNPVGAVEEYIYISQPIALPGTPPSTGWHFTWDSCCRNGATSNLVITNTANPSEGFTLRASMFPYTDPSGNILPASPCYDNSPIFKEEAKTILCIGYPFSYSNLGFDVELDSLSYAWDEPLDDIGFGTAFIPNVNPLPIPFLGVYSFNSPLPGGVTLNTTSGEISYNSNISGNFASVIRADAFKCGQKVASVYREIQVVLIGCGLLPSGNPNLPPIITPPIPTNGGQNWITSINPSTLLPSYETTVMAGQIVQFSVSATDDDINTAGNLQSLTLEIEGGQLDATLALSNPATFTVGSSSPGNVSGDFYWECNCDHMQDYGCGINGGAFTFNMKAYDDFCPANGIVIATITINVIPPKPDLRCLSVHSNGEVELSLVYPEGVADTNIKYDIYHSKEYLGNYTLLDSVYYPDSIYFHNSSDANNSQSFYYLLGTASCGTNTAGGNDSLLFSDTLSTILMNSSAINLGVTADLSWNPMHNPLIPSSSINYSLHYINNNNFDTVYSILTDTFTQIDGDNCNYTPGFYVEISDASGCVSKSSVTNLNLFDTISPTTPIVTDISVNQSGKAVIRWISSFGADYYIIYLEDDNGAWITLDTVFGTNSYEFVNSAAFQDIETFSVRAVDSCGNSRVKSLKQNSIFLFNSSDICDYSIFLEWNNYINWENDVSKYKVFLLELDENNVSTSNEINVSLNTELLINNINSLSTYSIYVEAYNEDSTFIAKSNVLDLNIAMPNRPLFNYLEYATVNHDNGLIEINCLVDNTAVIDHYDIYRTEEFDINGVGINFSKIDEVNFSGSTNFIFIDNQTNTNTNTYRYKVYPVDTCGVSLTPPPVNSPSYLGDVSHAQSILLEVEKNIDYSDISSLKSEFTNTLFFNEYEKWLGKVSKYELYRSVNNEPFNLLPLYTWNRNVSSDEELHYVDIVTNEGDGNGRFCYYIKASEGNITPYGSAILGSYSNISCVSQTPVIYIPNTFTPNRDDHNEIFKPFTYFVSEIGYLFSIYNKQGEKLFETNNPQKGWDGSFNNSQVQNDNYVYYLNYINGVGKLTNKTGVVTLVR